MPERPNIPTPRDSNETNMLIHLYRGELGRMTLYRVRLDTSTHWAVVTNAGIISFAFSDPNVSHAVFLFAMLLTLFFWTLEARRFRIYELVHERVRLLERGFLSEPLGAEGLSGWRAKLRDTLIHPVSPISGLEALAWRLRRNYLWIYAALLAAWWGKLTMIHNSVRGALTEAAVVNVSGPVVAGGVLLFYLALVSLATLGSRRYSVEPD